VRKLTPIEQLPLLAFFLALSCAKVGDPLPPIVQVPAPTSELRLVQDSERGTYLLLPIEEPVRKLEIYRSCEGPIEDETPFLQVERREVDHFGFGLEELAVPGPDPGRKCRYAVRFVGKGGKSALSNVVESDSLPAAEPPSRLRIDVLEDQLKLTWDPPVRNEDSSEPANIVGFLVNSKHFVPQAAFTEFDFEFGDPIRYWVQTVSKQSAPTILSRFSTPVEVVPEDSFPPHTPEGLRAVEVGARIQLVWDHVGATDLAGYYVYRRTETGSIERLSPLIEVNRFLDRSPPSGITFYYSVSAVDRRGNESRMAEPVSARVGLPQP
jgi:hypothetical protein